MRGAAVLAAGIIWITLGLSKAWSPEGLTSFLAASAPAVADLAICLSLLEIALGLAVIRSAFIPHSTTPLVGTVALGLLFAGLSVVPGPHGADCGCFGKVARTTQGRKLVVAGTLVFLGIAGFGGGASASGERQVR